MKFKWKDPKVWITTDNFLSFLLYVLSRPWARISVLWNSLRKSRSEQQEIQLSTGLLNGLGQCLTDTHYGWCNEILLPLNQLCFLVCCRESAGPWHYHFIPFFLERRWSQTTALPRPCSKSCGLLPHPSALYIPLLFGLMNQCTFLSVLNSDTVIM